MNINDTYTGYQPRLSGVCQERFSMSFFVIGISTISFILIIGIVGNSLVFVSMARCSYLRRTLSNYFVVSLALSDFLVCLSVLPFDIIYWIYFPRWTIGGYACNLWNSLFYMLMTASVLNLVTISVDRFIAVVFPFQYASWVTYRAVQVVVVSVWLYSVAVGIAMFLLLVPPDGDYYSFDLGHYAPIKWYLNIVNVLIPFAAMVTLYIKIYTIARHHSRRMTSSQRKHDVNSQTISDTLRRELRIAKALGIVVLCFLLCWLPYVVLNFITLDDIVIASCSIELADTVTCWLAYFNSAINPILYAYTGNDFRRAFRSVLTSARTSRNEDDSRSRSRTLSSIIGYAITTVQRQSTTHGNSGFDTKF